MIISTSSSSPLMPQCGDARIDLGEQCDDGARNSWNANAVCRPDCTFAHCGDGIIDAPLETCDNGPANGQLANPCDTQCHLIHAAPNVLPGSVIELPFTPASNQVPVIDIDTASLIAPAFPSPPTNAASGPGTIVVMAAGAAAGYSFMKRKNKVEGRR
jgi:hypothetical protein